MKSFNIAIFVSGRGSNMTSVLNACEDGSLDSRVKLVVSNKVDAPALDTARDYGVETLVIKGLSDLEIIDSLKKYDIDLIVLAGYMKVLGSELVNAFSEKIINIHPSLIPKHCGKGFYGIKVHQSVIDSKDAFSGATVHFVDEGVDTGRIILRESLEVHSTDSPESLAKRVLEIEHRILVKAIRLLEEK